MQVRLDKDVAELVARGARKNRRSLAKEVNMQLAQWYALKAKWKKK